MADEKESQKALIERLTAENAERGFVEFPKMKHHPDGRTAIVASGREESELGGEWMPSPDAALKVHRERDEAAAKRQAGQLSKKE